MIGTIHQMAEVGDDDALDAMWSILGAEMTRPGRREEHVAVLSELVRGACLGGGEIYAAERHADSELAVELGIDPERFSTTEALEDEIADELLRRLRSRLEGMDEEDLREQVAAMLKRMSDE